MLEFHVSEKGWYPVIFLLNIFFKKIYIAYIYIYLYCILLYTYYTYIFVLWFIYPKPHSLVGI